MTVTTKTTSEVIPTGKCSVGGPGCRKVCCNCPTCVTIKGQVNICGICAAAKKASAAK